MSDRIEKDSLGEVRVPVDALWGAQTQRAVDNFPMSGQPMPPEFIRAVVLVKKAAAEANHRLDLLDGDRYGAITSACDRVLEGGLEDQFPVDRYQTGSGTSTNMNVNEVLARLASSEQLEVDANDHVNMSQSSNDVIPTAIHVSSVIALQHQVLPALTHLQGVIYERENLLLNQVKTGRTHLMDAMPVTVGQELRTWREQFAAVGRRLEQSCEELLATPQGGTAVGTGINADSRFAGEFARVMHRLTGYRFRELEHKFVGISGVDVPVNLSAQYRGLASVLMKVANDLRWMNSGPIHGLGEISLQALQPGSSIMPGKVNPVIPEVVNQVAFEVIGNDMTITMAAEAGQLQLNAFEPVIFYSLHRSLTHLTAACLTLEKNCIRGITANRDRLRDSVEQSIGLVTALNPYIGYRNATEVALEAHRSGRGVVEIVLERGLVAPEHLAAIMRPENLTRPNEILVSPDPAS